MEPHPGISLGRELGAIAQAPFSGAYAPEKPARKKITSTGCTCGVCVSTPLGRYRRAIAPSDSPGGYRKGGVLAPLGR